MSEPVYVVVVPNGGKTFIARSASEVQACRDCDFEVHEMVPASEVREKDELIQKLADTIADETGATFMEMTFGLRMVGGTWEKVNG